jgi:hypothetical protein
MPLVFTIREGEPYSTLPEQPSHCECGHPLRYGPTTIHRILARR